MDRNPLHGSLPVTPSERIDEALSDKAIEWVVLLHSGRETPADHEAFARWREADRRHEMAAREAEAIWQGIGAAGRTIRSDAHGKTRTRMTRRAVLGLASVGLIGGGLVQSGLVRLTFLSDYATGIGEWKTVALSDGSTVQLNARSALSVGFDRARRLVSLTEGQAAFSVADDPARPFLVSAAGGQTRAAGGQFDVDIRPDDVAVTVLHGDVSVTAGRAMTATANQRILYDGQGALTKVAEVDADTETAWRRGKLVFNDRRLTDVVAEVERYRYGKIVLVGASLQRLSVSGVFDLTDPQSVLTTIRQTLPVRVTELPMVTIIRSA